MTGATLYIADMHLRWRRFAAVLLLLPASPTPKEAVVATARGTFEVKLAPQPAAHDHGAAALGRLSIDKEFRGDLVGTSKGEMLTAMTSVKESAGYVAIERVTGTLQGRRGSFVLQHSGTMTRGVQSLLITVVPDSGTEGLTGLAGTMAIIIAEGKHSYQFEYTLPPAQ
ncbi:MAG TPA: DUF3224 domain-containing protein [Gemmatimonadales bacterium]